MINKYIKLFYNNTNYNNKYLIIKQLHTGHYYYYLSMVIAISIS